MENEKERLGNITIGELGEEKGRYAVKIPAEGVDWVHGNYQPSDFMKEFVQEIRKPDNTLEDIEQSVFGLEYHRFTRESYRKKMSETGE